MLVKVLRGLEMYLEDLAPNRLDIVNLVSLDETWGSTLMETDKLRRYAGATVVQAID